MTRAAFGAPITCLPRLARVAGLGVALWAVGCGSNASSRPSAEPPGAEEAPPDTASAACEVRVAAVLHAESFRGYPSSPATQRHVDAMSPEDYAMWIGESHGASYLLCTYRVIVAGRAFRFEVPHDTSFEDAPPETCEGQRAEVEAQVRSVTAECTDLHRGAYYGFDLVPLDPA